MTELIQTRAIFHPRLHRKLSRVNGGRVGERLRKPIAQTPRAHRCYGLIHRMIKARGIRCVARERFEDFQVAQRGGIEREEVVILIKI